MPPDPPPSARDEVRAALARGEAPLRTCPACGRDARTRDERCPHCGASYFGRPPRVSAPASVAARRRAPWSVRRAGGRDRPGATPRTSAKRARPASAHARSRAEARACAAIQAPHRGAARPCARRSRRDARPAAGGARGAGRAPSRSSITRDARPARRPASSTGPISGTDCGPLLRAPDAVPDDRDAEPRDRALRLRRRQGRRGATRARPSAASAIRSSPRWTSTASRTCGAATRRRRARAARRWPSCASTARAWPRRAARSARATSTCPPAELARRSAVALARRARGPRLLAGALLGGLLAGGACVARSSALSAGRPSPARPLARVADDRRSTMPPSSTMPAEKISDLLPGLEAVVRRDRRRRHRRRGVVSSGSGAPSDGALWASAPAGARGRQSAARTASERHRGRATASRASLDWPHDAAQAATDQDRRRPASSPRCRRSSSAADEELEREQKFKAAALAILGARAAERYDAPAARAYFQKAIAAARPQERMQLRRMADASLALAERRPDDLKEAVERLGQAPPSGRQLLLLRIMGLLAPPPGASRAAALAASSLILALVVALLALGCGLVKLDRAAVRRRRHRGRAAAGHRRHRDRARRARARRPPPAGASQARRPPRASGPLSRRVRALHAGHARPRPGCATRFGLDERVELRRRFNVAPTDDVVAVTTDREGHPRGDVLRWGLVPVLGRRTRRSAAQMINARAETVAEKPAFRDAFASRRCLILADGFYEWQRRARAPSSRGGSRAADGEPFAFAGLWATWRPTGTEASSRCARARSSRRRPTPPCAPLHDRMPVILPPDAEAAWLDAATPAARLLELLAPLDPAATTHARGRHGGQRRPPRRRGLPRPAVGRRRAAGRALLTARLAPAVAAYDHVLLDLDGCVWVGDEPTPRAVEAVAALRAAGKGLAFVTNDGRSADDDHVRKLWRLGFKASREEVVTVGAARAVTCAPESTGARRTSSARGDPPPRGRRRAAHPPGLERARARRRRRRRRPRRPALRRAARRRPGGAARRRPAVRRARRDLPDARRPVAGDRVRSSPPSRRPRARPRATSASPTAELFRTALDRLGPGRALVVGDRLDADLAAAPGGGDRRRARADRRSRRRATRPDGVRVRRHARRPRPRVGLTRKMSAAMARRASPHRQPARRRRPRGAPCCPASRSACARSASRSAPSRRATCSTRGDLRARPRRRRTRWR